MGEHDIIRQSGERVECACGWTGTKEAHLQHWGIEKARAALPQQEEDSDDAA